MRIVLFFDLPSVSNSEKRAYRHFVKGLLKRGFIRIQESVFAKLSQNQTDVDLALASLKTIVPKGEEIQINIPKADGNVYEYHVTCKKDIKVYKVYGAHAFCVLWEPMKCSFTCSEDRDGKVHNENKLRVDDFYNGNVDYVNRLYGLAPGYEKNPVKGITYNGLSLEQYLLR